MTLKKDVATLVGHLEELNHDAQGIRYSNTVSGLAATDVQAAIDELDSLIGGGGYTDEMAQDAVAAMIQNGTGISWSYNDTLNTLTPTITLSPFTTTNLAEGSNLYFTDERAQDAVGGILTDSASIDFTYNDVANTITAVVLPAGVDHNSLANLTTGDPHTQYTKDPGTVVDKEITIWSGTGGRDFAASSGIAIGLSTALQITPTASNTNLLIDGNGTGVVQHNTGSSSYQMPKSRPASGTPGPMVLASAPSTGDCYWTDMSLTLLPSWSAVYSVSGGAEYFIVNNTDKGLRIRDAATPITGVLFAVRNNAESVNHFYVDSTGISTAGTITATGNITGGNLSGTNTGDQTITLTGDVTGSGTGSFAATIAANAVTNAKLAQMAALTIKGNNTGSTANTADLTVTQTQAMLQDGWLQLTVDNILLNGNTISTTSGDLILSPTTSNLQVAYLTAGSVIFAGTSGKLEQDNNYFFWDNTNKRLGLGVGAQETGVTIATVTYTSVLGIHAEGTTDVFELAAHRHTNNASLGAIFGGVRSRGTEASETAVQSGDYVLRLEAAGHDGTDYALSSQIDFVVDNTVSADIVPGRISFRTANTSGTMTEALRLDSSQNITAFGTLSGLTQLNVDNLRLDGNTISSTDTNGNIVLDPNGTGVIQLSANTELSSNLLKLGASNESSIFFDTGLVINPKVTGSGVLTIGSATGTADADLIINKMGIGNSPISVNAYVNGVISGSGRGILNFDLEFTGAGSSAVITASYLTDRGSSTNYTGAAYQGQTKAGANSGSGVPHSGNTTYYGAWLQNGYIAAEFNVSTGTHTTYGVRCDVDAFGLGSSSISGGTFRRYGVFIPSMGNIAGSPTSDLQMGIFSNESINVTSNIKIILDSTSTAEGDSYLIYNGTSGENEMYNDGTLAMVWDSDEVRSELPLTVKAGTSTSYGKVGGTIDVNTTAVGNVGTGEDDLITFSIPANAMSTNGQSVRFEMSGTYAANANTKRVRIKYGATTMFDSTALAINSGKWTCWGRIIRTGATTQTYYGEFTTNNALLVSQSFQGTAAETLSGAVTLKATGEATSNDDVKQETNYVNWDQTE